MAVLNIFKESAKELKSIRCIAVTGVLIAAYIVMEAFLSVNTGFIKINFAFLALAAIGMLYGPTVCVLAAIPCDIIGAAAQGQGLLFVFTLIAMFEGLIYGLFLYRYEVKKSLKQNSKIVIAQAIVVFVSHLIFNTTALYLLGFAGQTYESLFLFLISRAVKNLIELPIDIALMFLLLLPIKSAYIKVIKQIEIRVKLK